MSIFTFLMFALASSCAYIWWFHLRSKESSSAQQTSFAKWKTDRGLESRLHGVGRRAKEHLNEKLESSAETARISQVIHLTDIGLEMLSFDAQIKRKDLIKHKSYRWYFCYKTITNSNRYLAPHKTIVTIYILFFTLY